MWQGARTAQIICYYGKFKCPTSPTFYRIVLEVIIQIIIVEIVVVVQSNVPLRTDQGNGNPVGHCGEVAFSKELIYNLTTVNHIYSHSLCELHTSSLPIYIDVQEFSREMGTETERRILMRLYLMCHIIYKVLTLPYA